MEVKERRNFFRLPVELPVKYSPLNSGTVNMPSFNKASMLDLSGGGMRFESTQPLNADEKIVIRFSLPYNEKNITLQNFHLHASVVRTSYEDTKKTYGYGVEFINIMPGVQDRIIKYLFDLQIATREA